MNWWRAYHGLCTDPKLHGIARACGCNRALVIALWVGVLETASAARERGYVGDLDGTTFGFLVGMPQAKAAKILAAFKAAGMITESGWVTAWAERQRQSDDAAARKRAQRDRRSNALTSRPRHAPQPENDSSRQNLDVDASSKLLKNKDTVRASHGTNPSRSEQNREDSFPSGTSAPQAPPDLRAALWANAEAVLGRQGRSVIGRAIRDYGEDAVIVALLKTQRDQPAEPVAYFHGCCKSKGTTKRQRYVEATASDTIRQLMDRTAIDEAS